MNPIKFSLLFGGLTMGWLVTLFKFHYQVDVFCFGPILQPGCLLTESGSWLAKMAFCFLLGAQVGKGGVKPSSEFYTKTLLLGFWAMPPMLRPCGFEAPNLNSTW